MVEPGDLDSPKKPNAATIAFTPALLALYLPVYFLLDEGATARQLLYLFPAFLIIEVIATKKVGLNLSHLLYFALFLSFWGVRAAVTGEFQPKEALFIGLSLLVFVLRFQVSKIFPLLLLSGAATYVSVSLATSSAPFFGQSLASSRTAAETSFGLIVPLLSLYFFHNKRSLLFVFSTLLVILMFKRISFLGLALALLVHFVAQQPGGKHLSVIASTTIVLIALGVALNSVPVYTSLSDASIWWTGNYIGPDELSSGRYNAILHFDYIRLQNFAIFPGLFGAGAGYSTDLIGEISRQQMKNFPLLHNDFLRIAVDYGYVGLALIVVALLKSLTYDGLARAFGVFTATVFVSDNVATYLSYWLCVAFLIYTEEQSYPLKESY